MLAVTACGHSPSTHRSHKAPYSYTVRKGDNLYMISMRYRLNYRKVAAWNGIRSPYTIYPGQKLRLRPPAGSSHGHVTTSRPATSRPASTSSKKSSKPVSTTHRNTRSQTSNGPVASAKLGWRWPTRGKVISRFSSSANGKKGIDISGQPGQAVTAAAAGRVVYSGSGLRGYGRLIIINHNENYLSAYAHNRKLFVEEGEVVSSGQKIAELGSSGTDSPKLHFEIRRNGRPVDPLHYLP